MPLRPAIRFWGPPIVWTAVIFAASSASFSSTNTAFWLTRLINALVGRPLPHFDLLHFVIRKAAHVTEYGILSFLLFRAFRGDQPTRWNVRWSLAAIVIAAVVGSLDEWHQFYVPSRTASPIDTVVDTVGAALAQLILRAAQVLFS